MVDRIAAAGFLYLGWISVHVGFGGAESGHQKLISGIEEEWLFVAGLVLGAACVASAVLTWRRSWRGRQEARPGPARRMVSAAGAVVLLLAAILAFPAADGAADYYEVTRSRIAGWSSEWLGWMAIPLAANALAVAWLVLWPRVRG